MNIFESKNPEETKKFAAEIIGDHKLILLSGELGSGKTTFTKGLGAGLGIPEAKIKSPSYTLIREYEEFMHVDFYRLEGPDEVVLGRIRGWLDEGRIAVIEWPEIMLDMLPGPYLHLEMRRTGENEREIHIL